MKDSSAINQLLADYMAGLEDPTVVEPLFSEIRHEIEERDGYLKDYVTIAEDGTVTAKVNALTDYKEKYESMRQKYIDRWMNGADDKVDPVDISDESDPEPDAETLPASELFVKGGE